MAGPETDYARRHRRFRLRSLAGTALLGLVLLAGCGSPQQDNADSTGALREAAPTGFSRAYAPRPFVFPRDHGAHPDFRDEWWYVTGNLDGDGGRRFGFQITFFRRSLTPHPAQRASHWAADQAYMAHFSITDAANNRFHAFERRARGALGLAGAHTAPFKVWLEDWRMQAEQGDDLPWVIAAREGDQALRLVVRNEKPPVAQGEQGLSRKSPEPGNASYYYSVTRLRAEGVVTLAGQAFPVHGLAWLDREWSSSALAPYQAGWDWFALQFQDGTELMYYHLRRKDGGIDPHSPGSRIDRDGAKSVLAQGDVDLAVTGQWRAPGGALYPAGWRMAVKPLNKTLIIQPVVADQELRGGARYWEGAVDVFDAANAGHPIGRGYAELTGYAGQQDALSNAARR